MPSGAGHDAAVFAELGIPSAMIFVRNNHGSHNPEETMDLEDFAVGTQALIALLRQFPL
jgi:N-carbamoyl-L-amino-acid hydrolase